MNRLDKLLDEMRKRYGNRKSVTLHFLEAFPVCAMDQNIIDATMRTRPEHPSSGRSLMETVTFQNLVSSESK